MTASSTPRRVLVVDDEPMVCDTFRMLLTTDGHTVEAVNSAESASVALEKGTFDLVIIDYALPVMKGDELAVAIKSRWPNQPIVIVSASAEILQARDQPLPGVDFILGKPFSIEELRDAMAKALVQD